MPRDPKLPPGGGNNNPINRPDLNDQKPTGGDGTNVGGNQGTGGATGTGGTTTPPVIDAGNPTVVDPGDGVDVQPNPVIDTGGPTFSVGGTPFSLAEVNPKLKTEGPYQVPTMATIPASIASDFGTPEQKLNLDALREVVGDPNVPTQTDAFRMNLMLGVGAMLKDTPMQHLTKIAAITPITVSNTEVLVNPDGANRSERMGIRAHTYSTVRGAHGTEWPELTRMAHEMGDDMIQKQMMHRKDSRATGGPGDIVGHDHALEFTSTHEGWFDPAFDENGVAVLVRGDYPTDYGDPPSGTGEYSFRSLAYTKDAILELMPPAEAQKLRDDPASYREIVDFARTLSALSMGKVKFSSSDQDPHDRSYFVNDLDLDTSAKVPRWVDALGSKLDAQIEGRDGDQVSVKDFVDRRTRYCAEGANDRPTFLSHAKPTEALHEMKAIFDKAVKEDMATRGSDHADNRVGWKALESAGYIDNYDGLEITNAAYLPFTVPEMGFQSLAERGMNVLKADSVDEPGNGLLHQPLSIAGMVEGALGTLLPRGTMAATLSQQIKDAYHNPPDGAAKAGILAEAGALVKDAVGKARDAMTGAGIPEAAAKAAVPDPDLSNLDSIADAAGLVLASQIQLGVLKDPKIQGQIHKQIRREHMDDAGQTRVDALIGEYMAMVGNPTMSEEKLHVALHKKNDETRNETFTFKFEAPNGGGERIVKDRPIVYLAPHAESLKTLGFLPNRGMEYLADHFPDGFAS